MTKKPFVVFLAMLLLVTSLVGGGLSYADYVDIPDNWAREAVEYVLEHGLVEGSNGRIRPNDPLTRAELATIASRMLDLKEEADLGGYKDVREGDWFYQAFSKTVAAKIFEGNNGRLYPDRPATREESFAVMGRIFMPENKDRSSLEKFHDSHDISSWARDIIEELVSNDYIRGDRLNKLNPGKDITRAEFFSFLSNLTSDFVQEAGRLEDKSIEGNLLVNAGDVSLSGVVVNGDLILAEGVELSSMDLADTKIRGRILVRSGYGLNLLGSEVDRIVVLDRVKEFNTELDKGSVVDAIITDTKIHVRGDGRLEEVIFKEGSSESKVDTADTEVILRGADSIRDRNDQEIREDSIINTRPSEPSRPSEPPTSPSYPGTDEPTEEEKLAAAKAAKLEEIEAIELTDEDKKGKTEESIAKAEDKLKELKEEAKKAVEGAKTVEEVNEVKVDIEEARELLVDKLVAAKAAKLKEIEAIELTDDDREGKTEESIEAANEKLKELKEEAKKAVEEAETVKAVNEVKVDIEEAKKLLVDELTEDELQQAAEAAVVAVAEAVRDDGDDVDSLIAQAKEAIEKVTNTDISKGLNERLAKQKKLNEASNILKGEKEIELAEGVSEEEIKQAVEGILVDVEGVEVEIVGFKETNNTQTISLTVDGAIIEREVKFTVVADKAIKEIDISGKSNIKIRTKSNGDISLDGLKELIKKLDPSITDDKKIDDLFNSVFGNEEIDVSGLDAKMVKTIWEEVKKSEASNKLMPYRVTILDGEKAIGKIAIYENGEAVIEKSEDKILEEEGKLIYLDEGLKDLKTDNLMFMAKRIQVADEGKTTQLAVTREDLIEAYDNKDSEIRGKNFKGEEVDAKIASEAYEEGGLSIDLSIEDGKLYLNNTGMSEKLFEAIKVSDKADKDKPYSITITNGSANNPKTKLAKIEFTLEDDEVVARLVAIKAED